MRSTMVRVGLVMVGVIAWAGHGGAQTPKGKEVSPPAPSPVSVARQFVEEVYNQRRPERIAAFVHADFVDHSPGAAADARGPEFVRTQYGNTYGAFPDLKFTVDLCVAEGDKVAMVWTSRGMFTGTLGSVAGKGQAIAVSGISIFRVQEGQIIESWDMVDRLAMLKQAGYAVTAPAQ